MYDIVVLHALLYPEESLAGLSIQSHLHFYSWLFLLLLCARQCFCFLCITYRDEFNQRVDRSLSFSFSLCISIEFENEKKMSANKTTQQPFLHILHLWDRASLHIVWICYYMQSFVVVVALILHVNAFYLFGLILLVFTCLFILFIF